MYNTLGSDKQRSGVGARLQDRHQLAEFLAANNCARMCEYEGPAGSTYAVYVGHGSPFIVNYYAEGGTWDILVPVGGRTSSVATTLEAAQDYLDSGEPDWSPHGTQVERARRVTGLREDLAPVSLCTSTTVGGQHQVELRGALREGAGPLLARVLIGPDSRIVVTARATR